MSVNVKELMEQSAKYNQLREAVSFRGNALSYGEAWVRGIRLANGLLSLGVEPGDRVGVLESNCLEAADFYQAGAIGNFVRVPLYARNSPDIHLHMLENTQCKALLVSPEYCHEIEGIEASLPDLKIIVRDDSYHTWLSDQSDEDPGVEISSDDYFIIRHTGGTTGKPKAVAYTHRGWIDACRDWFYIFPQLLPGDGCLHVGPISHASGYQYLPTWLGGGCNVMVDHFDVDETLEMISSGKVSYVQLVSTMVRSIVQHPKAKSTNFSGLKCVLVGAGPSQDATILAARELMGDVLYQGYGQTEVLPVAFMGPEQWFADIEGSEPLRACGTRLPYALIDIWGDDNKPLPIGEVGEIVAKTDGQMFGFWNNPEATGERIVNGWVKTGDIGRIDKNGYVYLLDRSDDMIISGGYNIWPSEIENVVASHPKVKEVVAFGIPDEKWGETPCVVCVVEQMEAVDASEVRHMVEKALGSYKKPSQVHFQCEPLPKTPAGKLKRKDVREPYWAGAGRRIFGS